MSSEESDQQQIRAVIATWLKASAENDLDTVLGLMTEDAVFLRPGCPPMRGRAAYAAATQSMAGKIKLKGQPDIQEIHVSGDHAYVWNFLSITVTPLPDGFPKKSEGPILTVFRKEADGRWRLFRDANMLTSSASA